MAIKTSDLGSVSTAFSSMALAIVQPTHPRAYSTCCHAYTAKILDLNLDVLPDDYSVILLGHKGEVLHSVIVDENDKIIADTQQALRKIKSIFDRETGLYSSKLYSGSSQETQYEVIARLTVGEFKGQYLAPTPVAAKQNPCIPAQLSL